MSHQSHDCVKMTSFTGKHESCEPSALRSDIINTHRTGHVIELVNTLYILIVAGLG